MMNFDTWQQTASEKYRAEKPEDRKKEESKAMKKYRIKQVGDLFYPQERSFLFFWDNIKLYDRASRDWFVKSAQDNLYNGTVGYQICKDAWDVTRWISPEFDTLEHAKVFIEEYKKFLEERRQKQKAKYYY